MTAGEARVVLALDALRPLGEGSTAERFVRDLAEAAADGGGPELTTKQRSFVRKLARKLEVRGWQEYMRGNVG